MLLQLEPSFVTSRCPLLAAEAADNYSARACMRVPRHSAWVAMQIDISAFADNGGDIQLPALESALQRCVDEGDRLHDQTAWQEPLIEYDSWLNRRLAIALRGWGNIVERRRACPESFSTLQEMEQLAEWSCEAVHDRSRELARQLEWCPALDEVGAGVLQKKRAGTWDERWTKAVANVAVRHRNLTTMSPWDVFPRRGLADSRYANLLPLTRFADSLSFQRDVEIRHWSSNELNRFRKRVAAIVDCHNGAGLVAEQV